MSEGRELNRVHSDRRWHAVAGLLAMGVSATVLATTPGDAVGASKAGMELVMSGAPVQRSEVCGHVRSVAVTAAGAPVGVRVTGVRRVATVIVERCAGGRWREPTRHRVVPRTGRYSARLKIGGSGDVRLRARSRNVRSRPAYLRIGTPDLRVRKSVTALSRRERARFVAAVLKLKAAPSPYDARYSYFDQFVAWHLALSHCDTRDPLMDHKMRGHGGPMFGPWHREFLLLFEDALRQVSGTDVTIPYWDWTDPASVASVFAEDFMGGDGDPNQDYAVTTGPFRKGSWRLEVLAQGLQWRSSAIPYLTRRMGSIGGTTLPTSADVRQAFAASLYDVAPFDDTSDPARSFRNALEGWPQRGIGDNFCGPDGQALVLPLGAGHKLHNAVHLWTGGTLNRTPLRLGTMTVVEHSPNDPVFFLHHANIDRLWAQWQQTRGVDTYLPESGVAHNSAHDVMYPFDKHGIKATPRTVADIAQLGYRYAGLSAKPRANVSRAHAANTPVFDHRSQDRRRLVCLLGGDRGRPARTPGRTQSWGSR